MLHTAGPHKSEAHSSRRAPPPFFPLGRPHGGAHVDEVDLTHSLTYREFGKPLDVLELTEAELPSPGPNEVCLRLLAAPINPSDYGMILGKYGVSKPLPAVAGREGVAEVEEVGMSVSELRSGDRVLLPGEVGTWQTRFTVPAEGLEIVPEGVPEDYAAMAKVNPPTAWRILRDAHLESGSWVIQNASNSAVGLFVIQMARHLGLHTLNVVRHERWIEPLRELGADLVVTEESGYEKDLGALLGKARPQLAINSVGGESALRLVKTLGRGGTHVTIGAMSFEPTRFPTRQLIFDDITLKGFWMDRWFRDNSEARARVMCDNLYNLVRSGVIRAPVAARYPLSEYKEAFAADQQTRLGKVLLVGEGA